MIIPLNISLPILGFVFLIFLVGFVVSQKVKPLSPDEHYEVEDGPRGS